MNMSDRIRVYDLDADERRRIEEAEARHQASITRRMLEEIRDAVMAMDAMLIGVLMRS